MKLGISTEVSCAREREQLVSHLLPPFSVFKDETEAIVAVHCEAMHLIGIFYFAFKHCVVSTA